MLTRGKAGGSSTLLKVVRKVSCCGTKGDQRSNPSVTPFVQRGIAWFPETSDIPKSSHLLDVQDDMKLTTGARTSISKYRPGRGTIDHLNWDFTFLELDTSPPIGRRKPRGERRDRSAPSTAVNLTRKH